MQICHFVLFWHADSRKMANWGGAGQGVFSGRHDVRAGWIIADYCMAHFSNAISQTPALPNKAA